MGESSYPIQLGLNTDNSWSKCKQEEWVFLCLQKVPSYGTEIKTLPSACDWHRWFTREWDDVNQNLFCFGKSNNSKYLEKLPEFCDFRLSDETIWNKQSKDSKIWIKYWVTLSRHTGE